MGCARRRTGRSVIRTRPGPDHEIFAAIYERIARDEPLTFQDRRKLEQLLEQLLTGKDVRQLFRVPVEGRPTDQEYALFIAADVELRKPSHSELKAARGAVAAHWNLTDGEVK